MNTIRFIVCCGVLLLSIVFSGFIVKSSSVSNTTAGKNFGDTTSFAPNTVGGWGILASYLNQDTPDSVSLWLILKRNGRIDKINDHLIGTITNPAFRPANNQKLDYYLLKDNVWFIRITKDGECYLKQDRGQLLKPSTLAGNPDVIPINIRYKKN